MTETSILSQIQALSPAQFKLVCQKIVGGLGFVHASELSLPEIAVAFQETIERRSTDGMFVTKESWLLAFVHPRVQSIADSLQASLQGAQIADIQNILVVTFSDVDAASMATYHTNAKQVGIRSVLLSGFFAQILVQDYAQDMIRHVQKIPFSFVRLRERMKLQAQEAAWRKQFVSVSALPIHVSKVQRKQAGGETKKAVANQDILDESDLFGAIYQSSSFLLLGDPGAGKTTCLQELAEELATVGGRTPVFLSLNRFEGNLLEDLGEALCGNVGQLSDQEVENLLSSGALTVIMDGLNEVQSQTLQPELIKQINARTNPAAPTTRSHWITSGRRYDYTYAPQLNYLEQNTWELLPLDASQIYQFLVNVLGQEKGKQAYFSLGRNVREVCSNPLLLNMLLSVHKESGKLSANRGVLYHQFVDQLLRRSVELPNYRKELNDLSALIGSKLTIDTYCSLARSVLSDLAEEMQVRGTTAIGLKELIDVFNRSYPLSLDAALSEKSAKELYQGLLKRGVLRFISGKIIFFHHTFQEYFYAGKLRKQPIEKWFPSGGISGALRESIVFMAATLESSEDLCKLINRALSSDVLLAYEIMRSTNTPLNEEIQLRVASSLWSQVQVGGRYIGANKRYAQILVDMATYLDRSVEQLFRDILEDSDEKVFLAAQLSLYQEIGDMAAQQLLVKNIDFQEDIYEDLIFKIAITASDAGETKKAIALYGLYIELNEKYISKNIDINRNVAAAYSNRAGIYEGIGSRKKAEDDYMRSLNMNSSNAITRTNYATLLIADNRKEQALEELRIAIKSDQQYYDAHFQLGQLLTVKDPSLALFHLEEATLLAPNSDRQTRCLEKLLDMQEKLGYLAGAMISIKRLIDLNPTSTQVHGWKEKYAQLRLQYTETQRGKVESGDASLAIMAKNVLHMAGWQIDYAGMQQLRAVSDRSGLVSPLPVLLLDVPQVTKALVQERIADLQREEKDLKCVVLLTAAEVVDSEARIYLAQCQYSVALITSVELREAMMRGERACYELFTNAIERAAKRGNPFRYVKLVQERSEFFGREQQKEDFTSLILRRELVSLYGIHRIGKSSLLRQVRQHLTVYAQYITPVWIELSRDIKNPADLYRKILTELYGTTKDFGHVLLSTEQFQRELYAFQKHRQRDHFGHQILLILDEYPYLLPGKSGAQGIQDYMEVLGVFKILFQEGWFNFLPCGRTTALSRVGRWPEGENPFIGMFQEQFLGPLARNEVEELVKVLGFKVGLDFNDAAIERMWMLAGGHPFFTRTLGSFIIDKLGRGIQSFHNFSINGSMIDDAAEAFLRSGSEVALLRKIYEEELEGEEQRIVEILATSSQPLPRIALKVDNASSAERRQTRMAVENLLATSVLQEDEQRRLSHRYELLRRVIVQDMDY